MFVLAEFYSANFGCFVSSTVDVNGSMLLSMKVRMNWQKKIQEIEHTPGHHPHSLHVKNHPTETNKLPNKN